MQVASALFHQVDFEVLVVHCGLANTELIENTSVLRNAVGCHSWKPLSLLPPLSGASHHGG